MSPVVPRRRQAAMPFIMAAVLIDMMSIGLILPVLPRLVSSFASTRGAQVEAYAAVVAAFGISNFVGAPLLGALSDRFGRRPVMLVGFCGLMASFFVTALASALWMLVAVRLVSGAMQGNEAVANAYVADITPAPDRARRFGQLGAMFGVGFILGPMLGGLLGGIDLRLPFFCAGALAVCNALYGLFLLPESLPPERRRPFRWTNANPIGALRSLSRLDGMGALLGVVACVSLSQFILESTWGLYLQLKFDWGPGEIGASLCVVGVVSVLVQGVLVGRLSRRMPVRRLAILGLLSSAIAYTAWGAATAGWMVYLLVAANLLGFATTAAVQSLVSDAADPDALGRTLGAVAGLSSLMAVIAPAAGPLMLRAVADAPRGDWRLGAPFYGCALLQVAALRLLLRRGPGPGVAAAVPS